MQLTLTVDSHVGIAMLQGFGMLQGEDWRLRLVKVDVRGLSQGKEVKEVA